MSPWGFCESMVENCRFLLFLYYDSLFGDLAAFLFRDFLSHVFRFSFSFFFFVNLG